MEQRCQSRPGQGLLDEWLADEDEADQSPTVIEPARLRSEIDEIAALAAMARSIGTDTKSKALLTALDIGFAEQGRMGAARKALIFTESRRTQDYLYAFLESHGYAGQVVTFSGTNNGPRTSAIHHAARLKFNIRCIISLLSFYINILITLQLSLQCQPSSTVENNRREFTEAGTVI